ncbi:MAG: universal stress protein [Verrucomicrobiota bacterium]
MFKTIMVGTDGSPAAEVATRYAVWLANRLRSRLIAIHVTDIRILEGPLLADIAGAVGAQPYPAMLARVKEIQTDHANEILQSVAQLCREQNVTCEIVHETGSLVHTLLECERRADLVVLGQHGEHAQWHAEMLGSSVERMVRGSIKPCLVIPEKYRAPEKILIAHDGSIESTKALQVGLNLALALSAGVTLVTACQRDEEDAAAQTLQTAHELALARGLKPQVQLIHDNAENAILHQAEATAADLIVMGAYGRTRIREWILGSTTSHVLRKAAVPVLLARG